MSFSGKVVWITGASSGIGEALAYACSKEGAKLVLSARREAELERVKQQCTDPGSVLVLPLDLADHDSMPANIEVALSHFGGVDIMVHNAGLSQRSLVIETSVDVDRKLMEVDYLGTVALTKALLPSMIKNGGGHFVVVSSLVGKFGSPMRSGYAAAKHALHGFFDSMRAELHDDNILVTIICPGFINTNVSVNALTGDGTAQNRMDAATAQGLSAEVTAKHILKAVSNKKLEAYIGKKEIIGVYLKRFVPNIFAWYLRRAKVT